MSSSSSSNSSTMPRRDEVRLVSAQRSVSSRVRDIWQYRELLLSLVRKELKAKYKGSILGFAWSMLNPAFTLTIYYVVFQIVLANGIPMFAIYLMSGLLVWNFFSSALAGAVGSVTGSGSIVKKVAFPREVLPLASMGAAMFNFMLQCIVMMLALVLFQRAPSLEYLWLVPIAFLVLVLLASALSIFLSAVNVYFRDTAHLLELLLMFWFWMTPIVYQFGIVIDKLVNEGIPSRLWMLNPVTPITLTFQRALYNQLDFIDRDGKLQHLLPHAPASWYLWHLGLVAALAGGLLYGAMVVFGRLEGNFAEEL